MVEKPWEKEGWVTMMDEEHEIHGVTPDMIDWWWDNMEKGHKLWNPIEHHAFRWEEGKAPSEVGHIGAVPIEYHGAHHTGEMIGTWLDVSAFPFPINYEHCLVLGGSSPDNKNQFLSVHMYSVADYGTKHRFLLIAKGAKAEAVRELRKADKGANQPTQGDHTFATVEAERWPEFLPELYKLWSVVKDSECNPQCDLRIKKMPNGRYAYVTPQNKSGVNK